MDEGDGSKISPEKESQAGTGKQGGEWRKVIVWNAWAMIVIYQAHTGGAAK